ncbi:hypothetical protein HC256_000924 [Beauveria bassiana]|nr:hypothetical protein HC256_000924 [Beauveria bassiana]
MTWPSSVDAVALGLDAGELAVPLAAPRVGVVMAGEERHHAVDCGNGLHKRRVLLAIRALVGAALTPPLRLRASLFVVDARLAVGVHALVLQLDRRVGGNMHKAQRGDDAPVARPQAGARGREPLHHALVDPVGMVHGAAEAVALLVVVAAAAVKEPEE